MARKSKIVKLTPAVSERDHIQGPVTAPVTLAEYGDYQCPYCGEAYPIIKEIQGRLGNQLRFVFRNFPLTQIHPHAQHAAEAAAVQDKFWDMHDYLFEHQQSLDDSYLAQHAVMLGLDVSRFKREMNEHIYAAHVREDFLSGVRSGVNGTPTFFINGVRYDNSWDLDTLLNAIKLAGAGKLGRQ